MNNKKDNNWIYDIFSESGLNINSKKISKTKVQKSLSFDNVNVIKSLDGGASYDLCLSIIHCLGGKNNVMDINHCNTRIRLHISDDTNLNIKELINIGALAAFNIGDHSIHIVGNNGEIDKFPISQIALSIQEIISN